MRRVGGVGVAERAKQDPVGARRIEAAVKTPARLPARERGAGLGADGVADADVAGAVEK